MQAQSEAAIVKLEPATTQRAIILKEALKADTEQRALLAAFVKDHMVSGTDYGIIPGTEKPTLYKPGAEKLVDLYRCTARYKLMKVIEDWEKGLFYYLFRVTIRSRDTGSILAEGYGSANSKEGRYRWRDSQRKCPACGRATIFKSKQNDGWYCWNKKGGCGMQFTGDATAITSQVQGKVENDDIFTLVNTILKMAQKRALVAGAIALARCSDIFTQDLEDLAADVPADPPAPKEETKKVTTQDAARQKRIWSRASSAGITKDGFHIWVAKVLGQSRPSKDWSENDMGLLETALQGLEHEAAGDA